MDLKLWPWLYVVAMLEVLLTLPRVWPSLLLESTYLWFLPLLGFWVYRREALGGEGSSQEDSAARVFAAYLPFGAMASLLAMSLAAPFAQALPASLMAAVLFSATVASSAASTLTYMLLRAFGFGVSESRISVAAVLLTSLAWASAFALQAGPMRSGLPWLPLASSYAVGVASLAPRSRGALARAAAAWGLVYAIYLATALVTWALGPWRH